MKVFVAQSHRTPISPVPNLDLRRLKELSDSDCSFRSGQSSASASVIVDLKDIGADEINLLVGELLQAQNDQKRADEEE